jgi:cysteine desulfurase / selenocysteine lyase
MKKSIVYLDNAATSWPKPEEVYRAVDLAMRESGANPGRSSHRMSIEAERIVEDARRAAQDLFHAPSSERVVFTFNCTDALNIALRGLISPGDRVVVGPYEHNSVMRPLRSLVEEGAKLQVARGKPDLHIDLDSLRELCRGGVDYVVVSQASNVTGSILPVKEIAGIAHESGARLILDAAQSAGELPLDMEALGVDVLAAPGHKGLFGPMGTGILVAAGALPIRPLREGGSGINSEGDRQPTEYPYRLESGTANLPGIAGLLAGIRFVQSVGVSAIARHNAALAAKAFDALRDTKGVRLYCPPEGPDAGILSFRLESLDNGVAATLFDESFGIALRAGLHCAPSAHRSIGTMPEGTLRASFGYFNTEADVDSLVAAALELAGA